MHVPEPLKPAAMDSGVPTACRPPELLDAAKPRCTSRSRSSPPRWTEVQSRRAFTSPGRTSRLLADLGSTCGAATGDPVVPRVQVRFDPSTSFDLLRPPASRLLAGTCSTVDLHSVRRSAFLRLALLWRPCAERLAKSVIRGSEGSKTATVAGCISPCAREGPIIPKVLHAR